MSKCAAYIAYHTRPFDGIMITAYAPETSGENLHSLRRFFFTPLKNLGSFNNFSEGRTENMDYKGYELQKSRRLKEIGARVKQVRENAKGKPTQTAFGYSLQCFFKTRGSDHGAPRDGKDIAPTIAQIEAGTYSKDLLGILFRISEVYGVSLCWLITGEEREPEPSKPCGTRDFWRAVTELEQPYALEISVDDFAPCLERGGVSYITIRVPIAYCSDGVDGLPLHPAKIADKPFMSFVEAWRKSHENKGANKLFSRSIRESMIKQASALPNEIKPHTRDFALNAAVEAANENNK